MTEYVTCPFCKKETLQIYDPPDFKRVGALCVSCGAVMPNTFGREAMLAVIKGTHYDGPEVV